MQRNKMADIWVTQTLSCSNLTLLKVLSFTCASCVLGMMQDVFHKLKEAFSPQVD